MRTELLICLCLLPCAFCQAAPEWPRFRGPNGDGTVSESEAAGAPANWSSKENLAWKTPLPGSGSSSPVVSGGKIFLTCYSGYGITASDEASSTDLRRHAMCVDLESGKIAWDHKVEPVGEQTPYKGRYITTHGYASSSPVTDGEMIYYFLGDSGVFAYTADGERVWEASVGSGSHDWGSGASPILAGDHLIVNGASESDSVVAFNKKTGAKVWTYEGVPRAWNTPVIVDSGKQRQLLLATQRSIVSLNPDDGTERWQVPGIRAAELCPSIIVNDDVAYLIGSPKGQGMALRLGDSTPDQSDILWRTSKGSNVSSPVLHEGNLYFANDSRGILYCVRAEDGEILYEERLPGRGERIYASPLLVGDKIFYLSQSGVCYIVAAKPVFELLHTNSLADEDGSVFNASPALVNGNLIIRSNANLYCIRSGQ